MPIGWREARSLPALTGKRLDVAQRGRHVGVARPGGMEGRIEIVATMYRAGAQQLNRGQGRVSLRKEAGRISS